MILLMRKRGSSHVKQEVSDHAYHALDQGYRTTTKNA